ncbi:MAG: amidohydrolase family protein [Bacilli bacterium]
MKIDAHVHVGKSIFGYELSPEKLREDMLQNGIDVSILCPVQPYTYHLEPENDYIARLVREYGDVFVGFCRVDPRQGDKAVQEVERAISTLGLKGVFLHPWEEGYRVNADFVVAVVERASELRVPIMISTGYPWLSHALQVADLASQVSEAKIIMTNGGQINISGLAQADAYQALRRQDNLLIETSGVYRQDFLENVIKEFGSQRVVFGSNAPRMHQGFELDRAISATKNNHEHQVQVLGGAIRTILQID